MNDKSEAPTLHPVLRTLLAYLKANHGEMPEPLPTDATEAAHWWQSALVEASTDPLTAASYLTGFLAMNRTQRLAVVASVLDDKIPYRGDAFNVYQQIVDETFKMRSMGVEAYRVQTLELVQRAFGNVIPAT